MTFLGDEHVFGLYIAMQNQLLVSVIHRAADSDEQVQARPCGELSFHAERCNRLAFYVFHDEEGMTFGGVAAVQNRADIWMVKRRQNLSFLTEAARDLWCDISCTHCLDGNDLGVLIIHTLGEMYGTHSSCIQLSKEQIRPQAYAGRGVPFFKGRPVVELMPDCGIEHAVRIRLRTQERENVEDQRLISGRGTPYEIFLILLRQVSGLEKNLFDRLPTGIHHVSAFFPPNSRRNHAWPRRSSRPTVATEIPSTKASSSLVIPPKYFCSMIRAFLGSSMENRSRASCRSSRSKRGPSWARISGCRVTRSPASRFCAIRLRACSISTRFIVMAAMA